MAKAKKYTAVEIAAIKAQAPMARQHAVYAVERFTDRPDGESMADNARLRRIACVRALESLTKHNPRRKTPFLSDVQLMAASKYQSDWELARGSMSHEIKEWVQSTPDYQRFVQEQKDASARRNAIERRMAPTLRVYIETIIITHPDLTMSQIFKNKHKREIARDKIRDGLDWLAGEYGFKVRTGNQ